MSLEYALYAASNRGQVAVVELLLQTGADVNALGGYYGNALCVYYGNALCEASKEGQVAVVELLLQTGADVNAQGGYYGNALSVASKGGHVAVVELLLQNGADVNTHGGFFSNALCVASKRGQVAVVELLLQNGADVNTEFCFFSNALYAASEGGHVAVVELLLQNGANVNARDMSSESALSVASKGGHVAVVELLLQNGAGINAQGDLYGNALCVASREGQVAVVELLLQNGADVNTTAGFFSNALCVASERGQVAVVKILLQNGVDVNAQNGIYSHALSAASEGGHVAVVELLLQNGADVNARGGLYGNALCAASKEGEVAVVEILLQNGADVNAHGGFFSNALYAASNEGQIAVVELLLQNSKKHTIDDAIALLEKASAPAIKGQARARILAISAARERSKAIKLAKETAARELARPIRHEKEMAISAAAIQDDWKNVRRLVAQGYDPNCGRSFMERPLAVAIMHGNLEEAEFLLRNYAIRDLGDQFYPLRDAIFRKNVEEAQIVLTRPRSLKPPKVETNRQTLQRHFRGAHKIFLIGSQNTSVGQEYKELATEMESHKRMWRTGMTGLRRLIKNRSPQNLQQVIGILCVASAMRKSIQSEDTFGNHDLFLEDLDRWRKLAIRPQQWVLFDEIVFAIWGKKQNWSGTPDTLDVQEKDRYILFEAIRNMLHRFQTESSLPLAQLEHENFWEYYESSKETSISLNESKGSHNDNCESPNDSQIGSLPDLPVARDDHLPRNDPAEDWDWDPGLVPALLMMGAIFTCIIHFLFALHSGYVFLATSQNLSTQLKTSYQEFVSRTLAALPTAEIRSDLRCATASTIITLEGWALLDRCELMKSFLGCTDCWVPLLPALSTGGSSDPFLFDSESNSLSATTPTPSTLSSSSISTTSRHKCHICNEVLSNTGNLNRHLKRHQNWRKISCRNAQLGCPYSDIMRSNVKRHEIKYCKWRRIF